MVIEADIESAEAGRKVAAELFRTGLNPRSSSALWADALASARRSVESTILATEDLRHVSTALQATGRHCETLRMLMAPPLSQDRFALVCADYSKAAEKSGSPLPAGRATAIAEHFAQWRDESRVAMIQSGDDGDRRVAVEVTAAIMADRSMATSARGATSTNQETFVEEALVRAGWTRQKSAALETTGQLRPREFMRKARMANEGGLEQEVDIACGLDARGRVLALECKVSNDVTNSIKRANDVLNKARAWQKHWGNFVVTGALLQGVFGVNDVRKLLDANIHVFWQHDISSLIAWLDQKVT